MRGQRTVCLVIAVKNEYVDVGLAKALQRNRTYEFDSGESRWPRCIEKDDIRHQGCSAIERGVETHPETNHFKTPSNSL